MEELETTRSNHTVVITLARPQRRNALTRTLIEAVTQTCLELRSDTAIRTVVFNAKGKDFSVGVDLTDTGMREIGGAAIGERRRLLQIGPDMVRAIQELPQTTIAAMHGYCLGGGGCIALACDLRVAADDLQFGMPEVLRGMTMTWRTVPLMVAHFGPARTKELLITNCMLDAERAVLWGLANRRVSGSGAEAAAEAESWARELAESIPPITASMVKQTVNAVANINTPLVHMDTDQYILSQQTEDFAEAITSFLEKRKPKYRGR